MPSADPSPPSLSTVPLVGVAVNAALATVKILAGFFGNSYALIAAAALIAIQSVREILTPHHLPHWSTLLVLVLVVATKMILARWMGDIGAEAESTSLQADAWHHWADAQATVQTGHDIGGKVRSVLRTSPLRIADAFIHIEPARPPAA